MSLIEYKRKRHFKKSPEPPAKRGKTSGKLIFVVQKHAARRLHYDLRLELDGVLKSWALPRGPSLDPSQKHLAVMVEDHPLDYGSFEGTIPKGEYGAGEVIVWDTGTYEPDNNMAAGNISRRDAQTLIRNELDKGALKFTLHGKKLKGSWALVRLSADPKNWLLIKHHDEFATSSKSILDDGKSVISRQTIESLKDQDLPKKQHPLDNSEDSANVAGSEKTKLPKFIPPMLALLKPIPPTGDVWVFEPKLDGFRTLARMEKGELKLISRNNTDMTGYFPAIASELYAMKSVNVMLDGEVVAVDEKGRACFQCLQQAVGLPHSHTGKSYSTVYYVFDILYVNKSSLLNVPFEERHKILVNLIKPGVYVKPIEQFEGDGDLVYKAAVETGFEGIIAKKKRSVYEPGRRSGSWIKVKSTLSDEFVIGGFSEGAGKRKDSFASLLLGYYDTRGLIYAGSVGTGFNSELLHELKTKLAPLATKKSPFAEPIKSLRGVTWLKPKLVAEIKFAERTGGGMLRAPVFMRLRTDKKPSEIKQVKVELSRPFQPGEVTELSKSTRHILEVLQSRDDELSITVSSHKIALSDLNKIFWPEHRGRRALAKKDYLIYLAEVADFILPHLKDRPLTLTRYPDGIAGGKFYQKHWEFKLPEFVEKISLYSKENEAFQDYLMCNNLATLMWLGQIADLELHTWYSRVSERPDPPDVKPDREDAKHLGNFLAGFPDFLVFDIDPYIYSGKEHAGDEPELNRAAFQGAVDAALWLKEALEPFNLTPYVKTTGKTGLHVFVPVKRHYDYGAMRRAAATISGHIAGQHPDRITTEWTVAKRRGKVFLDYNQNSRGKTVASVYSARPTPWAGISLPFKWDELAGIYPADFNILNAPTRLAKTGDIWVDIIKNKRDIAQLLER